MKKHRPIRAKLIFNPSSGAPGESPRQLMHIIKEMQALNLVPEVHLTEPGGDLLPVVRDALHHHIRLFVVCGGDGTINTVAGMLLGTHATLGIIPTGTQNNVALSLGIPGDIPTAVSLLRMGRRIKVDVGLATWGKIERPFLEVCSVGLVSTLFPAADDIQHGNLARIGDFMATLASASTAEMHLVMDKKQTINIQSHVVLIANMPYIGPHYQIIAGSPHDGLLDVLVFAELSKLALLSNIVKTIGGGLEDSRIQHYQVRRVAIDTNPPMPSMTDGLPLGVGPLSIRVRRRALAVMAGGSVPAAPLPDSEVIGESQPAPPGE